MKKRTIIVLIISIVLSLLVWILINMLILHKGGCCLALLRCNSPQVNINVPSFMGKCCQTCGSTFQKFLYERIILEWWVQLLVIFIIIFSILYLITKNK